MFQDGRGLGRAARQGSRPTGGRGCASRERTGAREMKAAGHAALRNSNRAAWSWPSCIQSLPETLATSSSATFCVL